MSGSGQCSSSSPTNHWLWSEQSRNSMVRFIGIILFTLSLVNRWKIWYPKVKRVWDLIKYIACLPVPLRPTGSTQGTMVLPDTDHYSKSTGSRSNPSLIKSNRWEPRWERTARCQHIPLLPKKKKKKNRERERERDGEDGKEKPEGHAFFPDRSSLSLVGHSQSHVNVPGSKVKRGAHTGLCMHVVNTFMESTKICKTDNLLKESFLYSRRDTVDT